MIAVTGYCINVHRAQSEMKELPTAKAINLRSCLPIQSTRCTRLIQTNIVSCEYSIAAVKFKTIEALAEEALSMLLDFALFLLLEALTKSSKNRKYL